VIAGFISEGKLAMPKRALQGCSNAALNSGSAPIGHNGGPSLAADELIPDPLVQKRYNVSAMTLWRWDHNPELGFPEPIRINGRKYRRVRELKAWESALPNNGEA